ncbi:GAF domain-containing sensor histidine kinase [Brevibacillus sp. M2.1A]|uniref:GAF domain-containing sensor histidine kinase n=1 Tax=Brevibacillus sp. M2.1A TaxID=2738980 RepID=UPI00156A88EB|nr:GAF domain-containing sensor histidine kinase [Brevibacillus sp. M2.1A]MCC8438550.1 GAF domain-containing sensor histidine kinase [Brevibacillus sp. M2.1A]
MTKQFGVRELIIIKSIAETIYRSKDVETLLNAALRDIVKLTEMQAGWIFLVDDVANQFTCPAHYQLPEALVKNNCNSLTTGSCWCLEEYWRGELKEPVIALRCQRLDPKTPYSYGDIEGITHHATIPITAGTRKFGILNVAAVGKEHFTAEELMLMESIAFRIGIALERNHLYQSEQKRANLYSQLGDFTRDLSKLLITEQIPEMVCRWIGEHLGCEHTAFFMEENGKLSRRASWEDGAINRRRKQFSFKEMNHTGEAFLHGETKIWRSQPNVEELNYRANVHSFVAVPLWFRDKPFGVIYAGFTEGRTFNKVEVEVIEALGSHITLAFENARLYQQQVELLKWEERNRLARDLHDSVSQMLFSLQFTVGGLETMLENPSEIVQRALKDMKDLTQEALTEMRSLILQLRPVGLEQGLLTGLFRYGKTLGLAVNNSVDSILELPNLVEEALFRIGQEALNNVRKYAGHPLVHISLKEQNGQVIMEIKDQGGGFSPYKMDGTSTFGMRTMRERAETLGGTFEIDSRVGKGTTIRVLIPLRS